MNYCVALWQISKYEVNYRYSWHNAGLGTPSQAHDPFEQYRKKLSDSFMKMITDRDKERAATKDSSKE